MLISSLRALHLSVLCLEVWARQPVQSLPRAPDCAKAWAQRARQLQMQSPQCQERFEFKTNVFITSNRSTGQGILPQGGVSACSRNSGRQPRGQRKFHISPRFLPLCSSPAGPASHGGQFGLPASPRDTGSRPEPDPEVTSQPTPATAGQMLRLSEPSPLGD